jgi:uncharacterized membrane protein YbjE (DUF340 family)
MTREPENPFQLKIKNSFLQNMFRNRAGILLIPTLMMAIQEQALNVLE